MANQTPLTFSAKVMLSQIFSDRYLVALADPHPTFIQEVSQLHHHYELLDIRENSKHYKTVYGIDLAVEL
jgi:hypothetical protein